MREQRPHRQSEQPTEITRTAMPEKRRSLLRSVGASLLTMGVVLGLGVALSLPNGARAEDNPWLETTKQAIGQELYFNAWGGSEKINRYIAWVGQRLKEDYGITLRHVKVTDTADVVSRVLAEKTAGKDEGGSVDLVWINGENFAAMKQHGLLFGPFTERLPNYELVDFADKPTTKEDFTIPVEGLEAPWGMAKFNFIYDSARVEKTPNSMTELLAWSESNPGRFTYPAPPDFIGSTFLKQALIELTDKPRALQRPVESPTQFEAVTAPLWAFLQQLHPHLWREGEQFPASSSQQLQLLDDGEVDIHMAFYPSAASSLIESGQLPESARTFVFEGGTIGNTHFVAIPYNAAHKEAAMVAANFLMSPEAQARKQDPAYWGDDTVLDLDKLSVNARAIFDGLELGVATLPPEELGPTLPEPHPSWMTAIEKAWQERYGQ